MKKRIVTLLCTAVLTLGLTMAPAMASGGPFYPIKVEEYTYGPLDELRINKVYQLSLSDDPSGIPTEDFVRGGRQYYLLDMIKEDEVGVDTQDYTDTITVDSDTNDLSKILKQLDAHREVTTEDGYTGLLALDYTSVKVEAKGYTIKILDLINMEKSHCYNPFVYLRNDNDVQRLVTNGYTVTANYTGQVAKTGCEVVTYTAIFGSVELAEDEQEPEASSQPEPPAPDTTPAETGTGPNLLPILGCVGGVAAVAVVVLWAVQNKKIGRRERT